MTRKRAFESGVLVVLGSILALFLVLPFLALFFETLTMGSVSIEHGVVAKALLLSLVTAGASLALVVIFGTPLAWLLARRTSPLLRGIELVCELPMMTPPAVSGLLLLFTFGKQGFVTRGLGLPSFAFTGLAVVLAGTFVAAPFYLQAALTAFRNVDPDIKDVCRTLGTGPFRFFFRILVPLSKRGLLAGAAMAFSRALGEFGATLLFAGNLEGKTQTLPLAIYGALESDVSAAMSCALVLTVLGFSSLLLLRSALGEPK